MAAVLACGPEAALSHRSAVELWGLREAGRGPIDVTAPGRRGRSPRGIASHRDDTFLATDRTVLRGIPCTTVARDAAGLRRGRPDLGAAQGCVGGGGVADPRSRGGASAHPPPPRPARSGPAADGDGRDPPGDEADAQRNGAGASAPVREGRSASPEVNVRLNVGGRRLEPDFLWREAGLILEADSRAYHDTDSAFQVDRKREQRFQLAGWRSVPLHLGADLRGTHRAGENDRGPAVPSRAAPPTGRYVELNATYRPVGPVAATGWAW